MESLKSVFIENWPKIEDCKNSKDYEDASDFRCQAILSYPLIFTPNNKIIFWGFEVELAKNGYDLLNNLVYLHTNNLEKLGFSAEEILKNVNCDRENKPLNRIITELKSEIKCRIGNEIACHIIRTIKGNEYNPFNKDKDKPNHEKNLEVEFIRKTIKKRYLNLVKLFPILRDYINFDDYHFSKFVFETEFENLISDNKSEENGKKCTYYKTFYSLVTESEGKIGCRAIRKKREYKKEPKPFNYAKPIVSKANFRDFLR